MARKKKPVVVEIDPLKNKKVTEREEIIVEGALRKPRNKKAIAEMAGMPTKRADRDVTRIIKREVVQRRLNERRKELLSHHRFHTNEIVGGLVQIARASIEDVIKIDSKTGNWQIDLRLARDMGMLNCIKKLGYDRHGRPIVEMYDRLRAKDQLADIFGLKSMPRSNDDAVKDLAARELMQEAEKHGQPMDYDQALEVVMAVEQQSDSVN